MRFYCRQQPGGALLQIPCDWKIKNLDYEKGFIPIEELHGHPGFKLPHFLTVGSYEPFESLSELCHELSKLILEQRANYWLLYYYSLNSICLLAAEENYFLELDYEVIEI